MIHQPMTLEAVDAQALPTLRRRVDRIMLVALWLHVPLVGGTAWLLGNGALVTGGAAACVMTAVTFAVMTWHATTARRAMVGVGAIVMVSLLLAAAAGGPWQTDLHMYYFAMLAVLAAYCDRGVIVVATAVTALHHLILNFIAPALVFAGGGDLGRVFLHGSILVIEAGSLFGLAGYLAALIAANDRNLNDAVQARRTIEAAITAQEAAQHLAAKAKHDTMQTISARFEATVGAIVEVVVSAAGELEATAKSLAVTAGATEQQSEAVATASSRAASNVQVVAAATHQLSASIAEIGQQVARASTMVKDSVRQAEFSNSQVKGLAEAAGRIGSVVELIGTIAGQTNLLALNATIEAARAGDAGRGFAVVASEVKALAVQTATATNDIAAQIKAILETTLASTRSIEGIAHMIIQVDETTAAIAAAVEQQGAATMEISSAVQQAAQGTTTVSGGLSSVRATAHDAGSAASRVLSAATRLSQNGQALSAQVGSFLGEVRAA